MTSYHFHTPFNPNTTQGRWEISGFRQSASFLIKAIGGSTSISNSDQYRAHALNHADARQTLMQGNFSSVVTCEAAMHHCPLESLFQSKGGVLMSDGSSERTVLHQGTEGLQPSSPRLDHPNSGSWNRLDVTPVQPTSSDPFMHNAILPPYFSLGKDNVTV